MAFNLEKYLDKRTKWQLLRILKEVIKDMNVSERESLIQALKGIKEKDWIK